MKAMILGLRSGEIIRVEKVRLYPKNWLDKAYSARFRAAEKLKGLSFGGGFVGSSEWAIGGALALGILGGLLSASARSDGAALLEEMKEAYNRAENESILADVQNIIGIDSPYHASWVYNELHEDIIDVTKMSPNEIYNLCYKYGIIYESVVEHSSSFLSSKYKIITNEIIKKDTVTFAHDDREFIVVHDGNNLRHIRWSDISSYTIQE